MIGTAVGDDLLGHHVTDTLKNMGVQGDVRFTKKYKTPLEVNVSDKKGARTYFWQRSEEILSTLGYCRSFLDQRIKTAVCGLVRWRYSYLACHERGAASSRACLSQF
jgi:hypothetical protein